MVNVPVYLSHGNVGSRHNLVSGRHDIKHVLYSIYRQLALGLVLYLYLYPIVKVTSVYIQFLPCFIHGR